MISFYERIFRAICACYFFHQEPRSINPIVRSNTEPIGFYCRNTIGSLLSETDRKPLSAIDKNLSDANPSVPTVRYRSNPILKIMKPHNTLYIMLKNLQ